MSASLASADPRQILVVDDIASNRKLLRVTLEHAGYAVVEAADGVEALALLDRQPVDAVISDILMPTMDGYRLCHEIRKSERWRALPFIFYSSTYRSSSDEKLALDLGGDKFLPKPASAEAIAGALDEVFSKHRPAARPEVTVHGELHLMKQYSARLVSKLEEQNVELYHRTLELEREIAERTQVEQKLRASEHRTQALARRLVEAEEAEQRRLSIELHDRIGQSLTALGINLNIIAGLLPPGTSLQCAARLRDSQTLLESTMASVRDLITELRPAVLDDYGLLAGLRWFGDQIRARTGITTEVLGEEPVPRLAPAVEGALFRIAQEALNNTVKHAATSQASVELKCATGRVALTIADDGAGFDPEKLALPGSRSHWGLAMMQERAEAAGARFRVESARGRGTRIVVELPRPT